MISIVEQTINFYLKNFKIPTLKDINIINDSYIKNNGSLFVTIYKKGNIRGSSGNIKEIKETLAEELIENTVIALSKDNRFSPVKLEEIKDLKIRIDKIINRTILQNNEILELNPTKQGILAIKKDYSNMVIILPNIDPILLSGSDFIPVLKSKFSISNFEEKDYILYKIETETTNNFDIK